jgi:hypothetical protein
MPLVILHHLLNAFVQLANKRGLKKKEIQFVPHRNHITSPLQNESEIQFVPHRNHITSPLQNESGLKPIYMEVCY